MAFEGNVVHTRPAGIWLACCPFGKAGGVWRYPTEQIAVKVAGVWEQAGTGVEYNGMTVPDVEIDASAAETETWLLADYFDSSKTGYADPSEINFGVIYQTGFNWIAAGEINELVNNVSWIFDSDPGTTLGTGTYALFMEDRSVANRGYVTFSNTFTIDVV